MTQHIPYHDMYSGPGESMGETRDLRKIRKIPGLELAAYYDENGDEVVWTRAKIYEWVEII